MGERGGRSERLGGEQEPGRGVMNFSKNREGEEGRKEEARRRTREISLTRTAGKKRRKKSKTGGTLVAELCPGSSSWSILHFHKL